MAGFWDVQVQECARGKGETAIGWLSRSGPLHLAPHALQEHCFEPGDRVIVVGQGESQQEQLEKPHCDDHDEFDYEIVTHLT